MKPSQFDYVAPTTVDEVVSHRANHDDNALLAGGQSLIPLLNFRLAAPAVLIDLRRVDELRGIELRDRALRVGSMTPQRDLEVSEAVRTHSPLVVKALQHVGHPQIRTRGTVGGSLAHADPAAELPAVMTALDATMHVAGPTASRAVPASDFSRGLFSTALEEDEVLTAVEIPVDPANSGTACVEVARRAGDYAICGAVARVSLNSDRAVEDARIAFFGVADRPFRSPELESILKGWAGEPALLEESASAARTSVPGRADLNGSVEYRQHLAGVVTARAFSEAFEDAKRGDDSGTSD